MLILGSISAHHAYIGRLNDSSFIQMSNFFSGRISNEKHVQHQQQNHIFKKFVCACKILQRYSFVLFLKDDFSSSAFHFQYVDPFLLRFPADSFSYF